MSKALAAAGVDIVITETIQTHGADFKPQLTRIMEQILTLSLSLLYPTR